MYKIYFGMMLSLLVTFGTNAQPIANFNMSYVGYMQFAAELSDVWGYVDEQGNEYAIVGRQNGVSIVDVTDPSNMTTVFGIPGLQTTWRDIKTFGDYAYVTCECYNGLLIIDMSPLPENTSLSYTFWYGDTLTFQSAHNLFIDENGFAYIFGANLQEGGAVILDLNVNPMDPKVVGLYNDHYLHDGVVRGDTLWGAAINIGEAQMIDVSDKENPMLLTSWKTPNAFTHNLWFSDDNRFLFTTDEVRNGAIGAYDVSNPFNPTRIDVWMPNDTGIIPHNTHFINDFLVTSHYTIGVSILDVSRPHNMVEVARYDTSPDYHYEGFSGCWGVYPWLPSGNIIATDIEKGLYVLSSTYPRACYLEGKVTDEHTGGPIFFPLIEVFEDDLSTEGSIVGDYAMGTLNAGTYTVKVSADGYYDKIIENVVLNNGELTQLDVELSNWPTGLEGTTAENELTVFPNPARDAITVVAKSSILSSALRGLDGRLIGLNATPLHHNTCQLDVSNVAAGLYTLELITERGVVSKPLSVVN